MERADIEHLTQQVRDEVTSRFPEGTVQQVVVLQYGDDPQIEPGALIVRLILAAAAGPGGGEQVADAFLQAHGDALKQLRGDLARQLPGLWKLEALASDDTGHRLVLVGQPHTLAARMAMTKSRDLTPVMTRLDGTDLETLDALITAGIAASRADAVRWALARIRERPAYAQLRERAREIERLKTEF
jgi:hypothetical protein